MPKGVSKKNALNFLINELKNKNKKIIYSGDSGNDLDIFLSGYKSILVKNASDKIKKTLKNKKLRNIYIAKGNFKGLNGNYSSGIIEGAYYFNFFK